MADITYTLIDSDPEEILGFEQYSAVDTNLIDSFLINNLFDPQKHFAELHIYSTTDELLESDNNFNGYRFLGNAQAAGKAGASVITIDPIKDSITYGYSNGGVTLLYHFINDLFTPDKSTAEFFINGISEDRTELRLLASTLDDSIIQQTAILLAEELKNQSYFDGFRLNFGSNNLLIGINIGIVEYNSQTAVTIKLYEPLPDTYDLGSTLHIVEIISDSVSYEIDAQTSVQDIQYKTLRSPNFNIDIQDNNITPSQYFNYNDLFSYPINNSNSEIYSKFNEKGIDISIDYNTFNGFIHFSSAQERLLNFKYKVDLLSSYSASLASISSSPQNLAGTSGSKHYYDNLITGVVNNFDHYERHLYYKSGSTSWPKVNNTKPYINAQSYLPGTKTLNPIITSWFTAQLDNTANYDSTNANLLTNTIPSYLRDDVNNENYLTFIHMIGQHFDNLWLYGKAVTDKYNADNRLDFGISRELVAEALKNFGVQLYSSNKSVQDLFTTIIGQSYQSGSEQITNYITGSLTGSNTPIQPTSFDNYQKEIQKRIYHNLPLLLKSKGTERGLRALINCFGIPADILDIKLYGGKNTTQLPFFGNSQYVTSSLDKIRLDNTGSIVSGNTLSSHTSIVKRDKKYTDDLHAIEIGFSPTDNIDAYIVSKSAATFNLDDYLGDPRSLYSDNYSGLFDKANTILSSSLGTMSSYDLQDYVRLIKFFDNTVFKMVNDFIPARSNADVGVIIKPNILNVSKAKSVSVSAAQPEYTGSIDTAFVSGSDGGMFSTTLPRTYEYLYNQEGIQQVQSYTLRGNSQLLDTSYRDIIQTPQGLNTKLLNWQTDQPLYTGELSGSVLQVSTRELNIDNPFKQISNTFTPTTLRAISKFPGTVCGIVPKIPFIVTTNPYNIVNSYNIPGNDSVTYFIKSGSETAVNITSTANNYTFTKNYTTYTVSASKPTPANCTGSAIFNTEFCNMTTTGLAPLSVEGGRRIDITPWFSIGLNTSSSYSASYSNLVGTSSILDPYNYYPASSSIYTTASIILQDNKIATCSTTASVKVYPTMSIVEIGVQDWALRNLDVDTYTDGTPIPEVTDSTQWQTLTIGAWCYLDNISANGSVYGKLYNWYAVVGIHDAASAADPTKRKSLYPSNWEVPTLNNYNTLISFLGGKLAAGGKMKATGTVEAGTGLWLSPNTGATNSSGFRGLPGGYKTNPHFVGKSFFNFTWLLGQDQNGLAHDFNLAHNDPFTQGTTNSGSANPTYGMSVRLIRPITRVLIGANQTSATSNASQMFTLYNLDTTKYRDGTLIPQASSSAQFNSYGDSGIGAWCYYNCDPANNTTYGKLYNWYAVNGNDGSGVQRNIAPVNYSVPTNAQWTTLSNYLGGLSVAGGKMKSTGTIQAGTGLWNSPNTGATNTSGFTGLPGGIHTYNGGFSQIGLVGAWWASDQQSSIYANSRVIEYNDITLLDGGNEKDYGFSVRLIKLASAWQTG